MLFLFHFYSTPFQQLQLLFKLMKECWYYEGAARLTSLRVKKDLMPLCRSFEIHV